MFIFYFFKLLGKKKYFFSFRKSTSCRISWRFLFIFHFFLSLLRHFAFSSMRSTFGGQVRSYPFNSNPNRKSQVVTLIGHPARITHDEHMMTKNEGGAWGGAVFVHRMGMGVSTCPSSVLEYCHFNPVRGRGRAY